MPHPHTADPCLLTCYPRKSIPTCHVNAIEPQYAKHSLAEYQKCYLSENGSRSQPLIIYLHARIENKVDQEMEVSAARSLADRVLATHRRLCIGLVGNPSQDLLDRPLVFMTLQEKLWQHREDPAERLKGRHRNCAAYAIQEAWQSGMHKRWRKQRWS